jgi:hypothetical protein
MSMFCHQCQETAKSAHAEHAYQLKKHSRKIFEFLMEGLSALVDLSLTKDDLLAMVLKPVKWDRDHGPPR